MARLPVCQYISKMKVAGFVGVCERTVGSQQGDIIACRGATMREVTHVRPHISGKDGEDCALCYMPHILRLQSLSALCLCIHMWRCVYLCVTAYHFFSVCLLHPYVYMPVCVCLSLLLPSSSAQHCVHKVNHLPHKSKELTEAFSYG